MNTTLLVSSNQAWNVLHELVRLRAPLEAPPFNALLTELGRRGDVNGMTTVLAEMKESDIMPEVGTLVILVNQLCKLGRVDEAMEVFDKIGEESESDGLSVEADAGRLEEGLHLMEPMKSTKGLAPNTVAYNCLDDGGTINRWSRSRRPGTEYQFPATCSVIDWPVESDLGTDMVTSARIEVRRRRKRWSLADWSGERVADIDDEKDHGRINSAIVFFNDTRGRGPKGNTATYATLITALCDVDDFPKAVDLFDQMLRSGCSADATVCYSLIYGFCKAGRMGDANDVLSQFKQAGFLPDIKCYNALVNGLSGDLALALRVMKRMIKDGLVPTTDTYRSLLHACCLNGKTKGAMKLFTDMSSISMIPPNTITYNILIESLCKNN
ncbi:hypothetical protein GOBAR_AA20988 [Gossypium barbadense]|uniref:Pentacotripeptide-repeat region of PRORP domain-containing protein n=1 Tax=Gossypium barbadense TaxID=3634 RepID=A0A2P5X8M8_GOSBA|nr:hypothetical protein GOBAR_AA20988 [Gossypium barbadense]